jgi:hypothetical protein
MKYLYGIIPAQAAAPEYANVAFASPCGEFEIMADGDLAAITSDTCIPAFTDIPRGDLMRYLAMHQAAVESVMQQTPVLPVKFGTQLEDDQVDTVLHIGRTEFCHALEVVGDRHEVDVAVTWAPAEVIGRIAVNPAILALRAQAEAAPPEQRTQASIAVGRAVKEAFDTERNQLRDALVEAFVPCVSRWRLNPVMDDSMVMNVACLVTAEEEEALEDRAQELDAEYDGKLQFRLIGPLPPYSFATVEARAVRQCDLDTACALLDVPASSTPEQVKLAYYRQARRYHPDLAGTDPVAQAQFVKVTEAYRLMTEIAQRVPAGGFGFHNGTPHLLVHVGGLDT